MIRTRVTQRSVPKQCRSRFPGMTVIMDRDRGGGIRILEHPGRSRMDIKCALQKMMVTPKLDAFTLQSAMTHPSICRTAPPQTEHKDDAPSVLVREAGYLAAIDSDNCLLLGYLELSTACYESVTNMVERGQQLRVWSKFTSKFAERKLLANKATLARTPVLVSRSRSESSYPDPPPIANLPIYPSSTLVPDYRPPAPTKASKKKYAGGHVCIPEIGFNRRYKSVEPINRIPFFNRCIHRRMFWFGWRWYQILEGINYD